MLSSGSGYIFAQADNAAATATVREPLTKGPAKKNVVNLDKPVKSTTMESFYLDFTVIPSTGEWYIKEKTTHSHCKHHAGVKAEELQQLLT